MNSGDLYITENCLRALYRLTEGSGPEWRKRILDAVGCLNRIPDTEYFERWMSAETKAAWEAIRFPGAADLLTDGQIRTIAESMAAFIVESQRDIGGAKVNERQSCSQN